jgi:hypothetical protein
MCGQPLSRIYTEIHYQNNNFNNQPKTNYHEKGHPILRSSRYPQHCIFFLYITPRLGLSKPLAQQKENMPSQ